MAPKSSRVAPVTTVSGGESFQKSPDSIPSPHENDDDDVGVLDLDEDEIDARTMSPIADRVSRLIRQHLQLTRIGCELKDERVVRRTPIEQRAQVRRHPVIISIRDVSNRRHRLYADM